MQVVNRKIPLSLNSLGQVRAQDGGADNLVTLCEILPGNGAIPACGPWSGS